MDLSREDVARVCQDLIDRLAADGLPRPSVYLVRGNRLRIQAVRGYHQVFDGMPFGTGIIGRTYRTGETTLVEHVTDEASYLAASPGVASELAVPVRAEGRVVGVLNVEAVAPFGAETVARVEREAVALGAAIARLGHDVGESPAQSLARHALLLGELTERERIHEQAVIAACDLAAMDSAALLLPAPHGGVQVVAATGPLGPALLDAPSGELAAVAALVASGCSSYTVGGTEDTGEVLSALRGRGAEAVMVIPLPRRRGMLLVADRRPLTPATDAVELVEALAAQAESCLRTVAALEELRERAATDSLTGLGHQATFHEALGRARARHEAIAVLVADLDGFKEVNDTRGHQAGDRLLRQTAAVLSASMRRGDELFRIGGDEFAALVRIADEREALAAGDRLREAVSGLGEVTLSVGVALPRTADDAASVLARADAALYRVKAQGRDGVALLP